MNPRYHVIPVLLFCGVVWWFIANRVVPEAKPADEPQAEQSDPVSEETVRRETAAYERETKVRIAELVRMEGEQQKRARATDGTEAARKTLQAIKQTAWSDLISTNWDAYQALRKKAAASPERQTRCTICQGNWYMRFCILCGSSGKCPTCTGTGKAGPDDYCPTCLGTGKCFRCCGSGKMSCPFCDDGMIVTKGPVPPTRMPVN